MRDRSYWKTHYVVEADGGEVERGLTRAAFASGGREHELLAFDGGRARPRC